MGERDAIAVVGAGCRFPGGADGPAEFWRLLREGADTVGEVPADRWDADALHDPDGGVPGTLYSRRGGFLDDVAGFDAGFFGIAPREARRIDPQHRLLLEVVWEALEDAGQDPTGLAGTRTGLYTGSLSADYQLRQLREAGTAGVGPWFTSGGEPSFGPGRIAYLLGLQGPVMSLATACSSSLVAVHLAVRGLRSGETDLAVAGGVNLILSPEVSMFMCRIGAMSRQGRCRVFDAAADGMVRSEGAAVVVLKRLADALADGDDVLAVIAGSAVNHDGQSAGLTTPNGAAQQALLRAALADAGLSPGAVGYVEAHGTGTPLGDPIEMGAIAAVLGAGRTPDDPLLVGSLKTNFGHFDAAAGVAGLLKAALALRHGEVPAHLHLETPNPAIRWDRWPVRVPRAATPWPGADRAAGVSAFGLSGTNAHVVLRQAPQPARPEPEPDGPLLLPISARSGAALAALARAHRDRLAEPGGDREYVRAAALRRPHHPGHRLAVVARDRAELSDRLGGFLAGEPVPGVAPGGRDGAAGPGVVFVLSGQGGQWAGMGRDLLALPAAAAALRECDAAIRAEAGWSVLDLLTDPGAGDRMADTGAAQPAVFALQLALAAQWEAWGVRPAAVAGHSMGEIAAARLAGVLDLADAVRIIVRRGALLRGAAGRGAMAAVDLPAARVVELAGDRVAIAAVNGPRSTVIAGAPGAVETATAALAAVGARVRALPGGYAFHSPQMDGYAADLAAALADLAPSAAAVPIVTTTPGDGRFDAAHWGRNVRERVEFAAAAGTLIGAGHRVFVELGPHPSLAGPLGRCLAEHGAEGLAVPSLRRGAPARETLLESLGRLYAEGLDIDWRQAAPGPAPSPRGLPRYPWQRQRYWFSDSAAPPAGTAPVPGLAPVPEGAPVPEPAPVPKPAPGPERQAAEARGGVRTPDRLRALVERTVRGVLESAPGAPVPHRRTFAELGMDSALAVELRQRLEAALGRRLPATLAFDHPTVELLAAHLAGERGAAPAAAEEEAGGREAVAIIGIGCRLPGGADGPDAYWRLLRAGRDAVGPAPEDRFPGAGAWPGGYLADVAGFDAPFFRIPPREARAMDPQQRVFLEVAWEALEDAGLVPSSLAGGRTGVYAGINSSDYTELVTRHPGNVDAFYGTGNTFAAAPGRLSHLLGLHGPSLAVDTACSSSLVAVHLACRALRDGDCDTAIAGGVNLILRPTIHRFSAAAGALAPDGRCKAFDAAADGYGRGEGCGVVVLKPLSRALADGDRVHAVILGSAVNQDGPSAGFTAPYAPAQESLVRDALRDAGVTAADIGYVEAHGTGTPLGDPIELQALGAALGPRDPADPVLVGSAKTNLGHLEAASGMAGLIKAALMAEHGEIVPSLHFDRPSPRIPWAELPFAVAAGPSPWTGGRRVAGVSAFGMTGTNAHVVVAEPPASGPPPAAEPPPVHVLPVSAATADALEAQAGAYRAALAGGADPAALCAAAAHRREHLEHRLVVAARDGAGLAARLAGFDGTDAAGPDAAGPVTDGAATGRARDRSRPVFVFSGHGSQWPGMARDLLAGEPVFRAAVAECDDAMRPLLGWSVLDRLVAGDTRDETELQELVFAIQVGLAALWRSRGVEPGAVVGHSMGEVAAACVAGALDLPDAARLICTRSGVLERLVGLGGMGVVGLPADAAEAETAGYGDRLCVAVSNSSRSTVLSGDEEALAEVFARLRARGVFCRRVNAGGPGHSPYTEPLRADLVAALAGLRPRDGALPLYSSVTAGPLPGGALDAAYWGRNLREPVRFADTIRRMAADGFDAFVEISPHPLLLGPIEEEVRAAGADGVFVPSLRRDADGPATLLSAGIGGLHAGGYPVDWGRVVPRRRPDGAAPTYAWRHRRYWVEHDAPGADDPAEDAHPLLRRAATVGGRYQAEVDVDAGMAVRELNGALLVPAAAWLETAAAALAERFGPGPVACTGVEFPDPLLLEPGDVRTVRITVSAAGSAAFGVGDGTAVHATGRAARAPAGLPAPPPGGTEVEVLRDTGRPCRVLPPEVAAACEHALALAAGDAGPLVLAGVGRFTAVAAPGARCRVRAVATGRAGSDVVGDVHVLAEDGTVLAALLDARLRPAPAVPDAAARTALDALQHGLAWRDRPPPAGASDTSGPWLLLADAGGVADALRDRLAARGEEVVTVAADRARDPAALDGLLRRLVREHGCGAAVHLWALDLPPGPDAAAGEEAAAVALSVPALGRALAAAPGTARALVVTRGAVRVGGMEPAPVPAHAAVWHMAGVAALNHPASWGGLLDLDPVEAAPDAAADAVLAHAGGAGGEDRVALRGPRRLVPRVVRDPVRRPGAAPPVFAGACVVGEGWNAAGARIARWLAGHGADRVVVTGAGGGPAELAAQAPPGVEFRRTDLADPDRAEELVAELAAGGPLGGIVWLGLDWVLDDPAAATPTGLAAASARRALGAWRLDALAGDAVPMIVFGGAGSAWGSAGAARQAPADGMLAALAATRAERGGRVLHVAWTPWDEPALLDPGSRATLRRSGVEAIPADTAVAALDALLAAGRTEAAVADVDWGLMLPLYRQALPWPLFDELDPEPRDPADGLAGLPAEERRERVLDLVLAEVRTVLGLTDPDEPDPGAGFFDLGLGSITALELRIRLERRFGLRLPPTLAFEHPTAAALAAHLEAEAFGPPDPDPASAPASASADDADADADAALLAALHAEIAASRELTDRSPDDHAR
ncbi:beta-ketoacyl synthase N-terminal-like domain-containing protein [Actinomadura sp. GTD37]|uniref:type I polyketide synthase n=1 Tax=Actinomadura sp. GTD37 TaxID=1778030 RepID=UPI0035C066FD